MAFAFRRAYTFRMAETRAEASGEFVLCVALRHLGVEREVLVVKEKKNNFYAFPPYAKKPLGSFDFHMSWHESGERHAVSRLYDGRAWKKDARIETESAVKLTPPADIKGAVPLFHSGIFLHQFPDLPPVGTNAGDSVILDGEGANFRDDFIVVRVYLVEPGADDRIPSFPDTAPRILHLVKETSPWLAVEMYQQADARREKAASTI